MHRISSIYKDSLSVWPLFVCDSLADINEPTTGTNEAIDFSILIIVCLILQIA